MIPPLSVVMVDKSQHKTRIAVVGAMGYVGKGICGALRNDESIKITEVTRKNYAEKREHEYNIVINAAMPSKRFWARQHPIQDFDETVKKTSEIFYTWNYKKFIQISTVSSRCQLDTIYGRHKAAAETICSSPDTLIVRLGPMYSEGLEKGVLIDMLQGNTVFAHGDSRYCFVSLEFVSNWICSNLCRVGLVEVGGRNAIALKDVAQYLGQAINFQGALDHQEIEQPVSGFPEAGMVRKYLDSMLKRQEI